MSVAVTTVARGLDFEVTLPATGTGLTPSGGERPLDDDGRETSWYIDRLEFRSEFPHIPWGIDVAQYHPG